MPEHGCLTLFSAAVLLHMLPCKHAQYSLTPDGPGEVAIASVPDDDIPGVQLRLQHSITPSVAAVCIGSDSMHRPQAPGTCVCGSAMVTDVVVRSAFCMLDLLMLVDPYHEHGAVVVAGQHQRQHRQARPGEP